MKHLIIALFIVSLSVPSYAATSSDGTRGGGEVALKKNGEIVIADSLERIIGTGFSIKYELHQALSLAGHLLVIYGAKPYDLYEKSESHTIFPYKDLIFKTFNKDEWFLGYYLSSDFIEKNILSRKIEYRLVDQLPEIPECLIHNSNTEKKLDDPAILTTVMGACTKGRVTWIHKDYFNKMSTIDQAALLIHEGLHRLTGDYLHGFMTEFTSGIRTALDIFYQQLHGGKPILSSEQVTSIKSMLRQMINLDLTSEHNFYNTWNIVKNGGALVGPSPAKIPDTAYLGIGLVLHEFSEIGEGVFVTNTYCPAPHQWINGCIMDLGPGAVLRNVYFAASDSMGEIKLGKNSRIENVIFKSFILKSQEFVRPINKSQDIFLEEKAVIENSMMTPIVGSLHLRKGAKISNIALSSLNQHAFVADGPYSQALVAIEMGEFSLLSNIDHGGLVGPSSTEIKKESDWIPTLKIKSNAKLDFKGKGLRCHCDKWVCNKEGNICNCVKGPDAYTAWGHGLPKIMSTVNINSIADIMTHCNQNIKTVLNHWMD